jgi:hypothetical protein
MLLPLSRVISAQYQGSAERLLRRVNRITTAATDVACASLASPPLMPRSVRQTKMGATDMDFPTRMQALEQKFADAAASDGDPYLPNVTPSGPVDAVLIAMEPSLGRWASSPDEATQKIAAGFRNFMWSTEDFILHYAVRRFLCSSGRTYHVTDISKGAMTVEKATIGQDARYERWAKLLDEEIELIAKPGAHIIAIGNKAYDFLVRNGFDRGITRIIHYSPLARAARNAAVIGHEARVPSLCRKIIDAGHRRRGSRDHPREIHLSCDDHGNHGTPCEGNPIVRLAKEASVCLRNGIHQT